MTNAKSLKAAIEELCLSHIKEMMSKDWKKYDVLFFDKSKFEVYMDILNRSLLVGAHAKPVMTKMSYYMV